jgi:protein-S-isoprenylcysteine O-methyltransferase Ste14
MPRIPRRKEPSMSLRNELETQGQWLFRWRSFLPLICLPVLIVVLANMSWPFGSYQFHELWEVFCLAVSLAGLGIRVIAIGYVPDGTSGRNTKSQVAMSLNTTGIYSTVRHPLYLGNFLIGLGAVLIPFEWWLPLLYSAVYCVYYERIMYAEESFLLMRFGEAFTEWANVTPAFWPCLSHWRWPERSFSWRMVLRREYTGLIVVVLLHSSVEVIEHWIIDRQIRFEMSWAVLMIGSLTVYFVLRTLKKYTRLLSCVEC